MITEIEIENVRLFEDEGWKFPLAPLTIFCGTNSAGKSTLFKTLLLIRQSLGRRAPIIRPKFDGNFVNLGNYQSFVSNGDLKRDIRIAITIAPKTPWSNLQRFFGASIPEGLSNQDLGSYIFRTQFTLKSPTSFNRLQIDPLSSEKTEGEFERSGYLQQIKHELLIQHALVFSWDIVYERTVESDHREDVSYYKFNIPRGYFKMIKLPSELRKQISLRPKTIKLPVILEGFLPSTVVIPSQPSREQDGVAELPIATFVPVGLFRQIYEPTTALERALRGIAHIAPLRSQAQRFYIPSADEGIIDSAGKFLPYLLRDRRFATVKNVQPRQRVVKDESLSDALNSWLYYLRTGQTYGSEEQHSQEFDITNTNGVLLELSLRTPSGKALYPMLDSGVGLSQVLPILVRVLQAKDDTTILIEQPELHLNPAVQVRLAEFFVCMSRTRRQIILETHSEHIVNAIRVLAAEDESGAVSANSRIYFIDVEKGRPVVHDLSIQPDGMVPDWPPNFFGEALALTGRLLRAQKRFRNVR